MSKNKKTVKNDNTDKKVKDEKELVDPQVSQLEGQLKRALADYQNLERRIDEERRLLGTLTSALVIEKLLPVLDNLENAQKHLNDKGLEMVISQFKEVLRQEGVEEIQAEGTQFDPNEHEAIEVVELENAKGPERSRGDKVVKVLRKGYKINDKVLRPAQVAIGRSQKEENNQRIEKKEATEEYSSSE
ncbi:MAG: nucleotide exchange factor GrpE [Candidatus Curtissbacteria bacterium]|nr:nucleotide exchange factor GrpE [Candidatus Curtissbacteria bacterium]